MNKAVKSGLLFVTILYGLFFVSSLVYAGTMVCQNNQKITPETSTLYSFYTTGSGAEIISPTLKTDSGLVYSPYLDYKAGVPNTKYLIKINFDVYASTVGVHEVTISQGSAKSTVNMELVKGEEIESDVNITYPLENTNQKVQVALTLKNNTNKSTTVAIKPKELPDGIETNFAGKTILIKTGETKTLYFSLEYDEPISETVTYSLTYNKKKQDVAIELDKEKMPLVIKTNKITALFSLAKDATTKASDTKMIVIDVLLFVLIVVLFTMFIGRLGKYIVKNKIQNNGGRK